MAVGLNHYSELIRYIKSLLEQDDLVNTITQGNPESMDLNKMNIYPLANIEINDASFTNGQNVVFDVVISTMNQRDTTNEVNDSKIW